MSLHGWLILDKPLNISSAQAVGAVKRLLKPTKIGHGGTLDPLASGILPLALGEATKTFEYVVSHEKEYEFTVEWGTSTTTDDREGEAVNRSDQRPTEAEIRAILPEFTGIIMQRPPVFSAISQGGKRAYAMARAGQEVVLEARPVEVFSLQYIPSPLEGEGCAGLAQPEASLSRSWVRGMTMPTKKDTPHPDSQHSLHSLANPALSLKGRGENKSTLRITCGKGTYIRSIARDMGERLGCFGHVAALRRTRVGRFEEKSAISLDALKDMDYTLSSTLPLMGISDVLDDILGITLNANQTLRLRQGQQVELAAGQPMREEGTLLKCFAEVDGALIGIAKIESGRIKPVKNFNL